MGGTACVVAAAPSPGIVGKARRVATRVLVEKVCSLGIPVHLLTPEPGDWHGLDVHVHPTPSQGFHLGKGLAALVEELEVERLLYFSAGSGFLLDPEDIRGMMELELSSPFGVFNNFYSTDFALLAPPNPGILRELPSDNALGWAHWRAGYRCYELPRNAKTQLDIDTPGELQLLSCSPGLPPELAAVLSGMPRARAEVLLEILVSPGKNLFLVGRISGHLLRFLERTSACRTQALIEGRGMKAEGLPVRSLVRELLASRGPRGLVAALAAIGDAVVWDVRTLFGALGIWPSPEERFSFDLLEWDALKDPFLRELARAVAESPVPFLVGGHSLVSGAMYLAVELAWDRVPGAVPPGKVVRLEEEDERIVEISPGGGG
ncbi:MAG TPA: hypothetical protein ENF15_04555 [Candidatus Acetothermia bacterium]|nr:hypothetical protein [Candidatus Acetothermia bacterium]